MPAVATCDNNSYCYSCCFVHSYTVIYPTTNACNIVLAQEIETCVMYFLHENIKNRLTGYGKINR